MLVCFQSAPSMFDYFFPIQTEGFILRPHFFNAILMNFVVRRKLVELSKPTKWSLEAAVGKNHMPITVELKNNVFEVIFQLKSSLFNLCVIH